MRPPPPICISHESLLGNTSNIYADQQCHCFFVFLFFLLVVANLISSTQKSFNPQRYLYAVHADTSYDDLVHGVDNLKHSIDQRSSALKVLVQNNFDRFVSAKNVIDCMCHFIQG